MESDANKLSAASSAPCPKSRIHPSSPSLPPDRIVMGTVSRRLVECKRHRRDGLAGFKTSTASSHKCVMRIFMPEPVLDADMDVILLFRSVAACVNQYKVSAWLPPRPRP